MVIKYVAYNWQGRKIEGVLDVAREEDARELLQQQDLIPYRLTQVRARPSLSQLAPILFKPKPRDIIEFTRGLAALLRSGIPLHESLVILREQGSSLALKEIMRRIIEDVEGGGRFSEACARFPKAFSNYYVRLLRVGEATGGMTETLDRLAQTLESRKAVLDKVRSALTYPVISLIVAVVVTIILVTYSLPALIGLLDDYGGELPANTKLLISISDFLREQRLRILLFIFGAAAATAVYVKTEHGARMRDRALLRIPVVGRVLTQTDLYHLTSTFNVLLKSGIPSIEALELSKESLGNIILRERLERVIQEARSGARLGSALRKHWPSPPLLSRGIMTGETSGNLSEALEGLSTYYEQEAARSVEGATEMIQPAVILIVAGLVGFIATAVISGVYSALGSLE